MLKNHLRVSWRHLTKAKGYSLINVLGLTIGLSACITLFQICHYEFGFDRFHPNADRIYRAVSKRHGAGNTDWRSIGMISMGASHTIRDQYPGIENIANFYSYNVAVTVPASGVKIEAGKEYNMIITDSSWFSIFQYRWLAGTPSAEPFTVVLTANKARQYFGRLAADQYIGKKLVYDDSLTVTVTGIVQDWTQPTDLHFTDFISFSTQGASFLRYHTGFDNPTKPDNWSERTYAQTYLLLKKGVTPASFDKFAAGMLASKGPKQTPEDKLLITVQRLADLHFDAQYDDFYARKAHRPTLYVMTGIAVFILLLAIINFINLSTAQSLARAREVGTRKILGSGRRGIVAQFLTETALLVLAALTLSPLILILLFRLFPQFIPPGLHANSLLDPTNLGFALSAGVITLLLAGGYPALVIAGFSPTSSLKGEAPLKGSGRQWLRQSLIVFQFSLSLVFIVATVVVGRQLHFMLHKDLGVNQAGIVNIDLNHINPNLHYGEKDKTLLAARVRQLPGVRMAGLDMLNPTQKEARGFPLKDLSSGTQLSPDTRLGDENYVGIYGLNLIAGRNIRMPKFDTATEFLLSEKAAAEFGYAKPEDAIGRKMTVGGMWTGPVVGIFADFNSRSLHDPIVPVFLMTVTFPAFELSVRLDRDQPSPAVMAGIQKTFKSIYPTEAFNYTLFKDDVAALYSEEQRLSTLINAAMTISILIACMGLFGLAAFTAGRRTKEIGIRKVLGASITGIVTLLTRQFLKPVAIAFLIATPIAWWLMTKWLTDYPNRIALGWWMFALAGAAAMILALLTGGFHALKAAVANPVTALRSE